MTAYILSRDDLLLDLVLMMHMMFMMPMRKAMLDALAPRSSLSYTTNLLIRQ